MEAVIFLVIFYGGIAMVGWFFEEVRKWNEERKIKIRDKVMSEVLSYTDITDELLNEYKDKLNRIGCNSSTEISPFLLDIFSDGKKTHKHLVGKKCPECNDGYLRTIKGKYGKFLGCSSYPNCRYTKNLSNAIREYKQKSSDDFMKLFKSAYQ